jgi:hypothetical protein
VTGLVGRESEQAEIRGLVERARNGLSGVLVVRGEPGIGKTCLLDAVAASAAGFDVVRLVGIESEMRLGYAALHQLLTPFLTGIDLLPPPQARALKAAFGSLVVAGLEDHDRDLPSCVALVHVVAADDTAVEQRSEAAVLLVDERPEPLPFFGLGHPGMRWSVLPTDLYLHLGVGHQVEEPGRVPGCPTVGGHDHIVVAVPGVDESRRPRLTGLAAHRVEHQGRTASDVAADSTPRQPVDALMQQQVRTDDVRAWGMAHGAAA